MADLDVEPPSFSLGLDLDLDSDPKATPLPHPPSCSVRFPSTTANLCTIEEDDDDDDFQSPSKVAKPHGLDPPRALKRLRRGPNARPALEARTKMSLEAECDVDDDIEGFSSEEDCPRGKGPSGQTFPLQYGNLPTHSVCSSSQPSLHGKRVLTSQGTSQWNSIKSKEVASSSASIIGQPSSSNRLFPKLTISPLRRFQLIDSDSDDPSVSDDMAEESTHLNLPSKDKLENSSKQKSFSDLSTASASIGERQSKDLWKDFPSEKSFSIPTPAFHAVCEEYFTSRKRKSEAEITWNDASNGGELISTSAPPSHCYFFHKDARIRNLVRERLPHFFPLGAGSQYKEVASVIDYMGQFNHEDNSRHVNKRSNVGKSSTRTKRNTKSQVESENWVNPKSCAGLPKDAGKRRVQAVSKPGGHWYTGSDGRRVYVNKNGQELSGQIAYIQYRKDSGIGLNSKKKTSAKQKSAGRRKSSSKKR